MSLFKTLVLGPLILSLVDVATAMPTLDPAGKYLFVASSGSDDGTGSADAPFASITRARDAIREMRKQGALPAGGIAVVVRGGRYRIGESITLDEQDSGTPDAPILYRAYPSENVRLVGGADISDTDWNIVTDAAALDCLQPTARAHVRCADLSAVGFDRVSCWPTKFRGAPSVPELFFDDKAMQVARWPNEGWVTIAEVIDRGSMSKEEEQRGGTFVYKEDRQGHWDPAKGLWLHGYWCHDWYDECLKVESVDPATKRMTFAVPHSYGIGPLQKWNKVPRRYYALNLLAELDSPGEWFVDAASRKLYFWPPSELASGRSVVSALKRPIFILDRTAHVTIRGFTLECTQGDAVAVKGGTMNRIAGCTIRNTGGKAVGVEGGTDNGVIGCDIYQTGTAGIVINAGDRKTLTPGGNYAENNHIHHYARRQRTYAGAIRVNGVGNRASHNLVHDAPHSGIFYGGNDNIVEFNDIFRVAMETGDVGALYTGRDWGSQGNIIRHNFIHHTGGVNGWSMGVYLDDCASGDRVIGNVFYRVTRAAFIGGGRDNVVENNVFVECSPAVHVDARGTTRIKWNVGASESWDLLAKVEKYNYKQPPWSTRYPSLARIMDEDPTLPRHNTIARNVAVGGSWINNRGVDEALLNIEKNMITETDPGFRNADTLDFRFRKDAPVWTEIPGFKPIPLEKIGLYEDPLRASWPVTRPKLDGGLAIPLKALGVKPGKKVRLP